MRSEGCGDSTCCYLDIVTDTAPKPTYMLLPCMIVVKSVRVGEGTTHGCGKF